MWAMWPTRLTPLWFRQKKIWMLGWSTQTCMPHPAPTTSAACCWFLAQAACHLALDPKSDEPLAQTLATRRFKDD